MCAALVLRASALRASVLRASVLRSICVGFVGCVTRLCGWAWGLAGQVHVQVTRSNGIMWGLGAWDQVHVCVRRDDLSGDAGEVNLRC